MTKNLMGDEKGVKNDSGKSRMSLLPIEPLTEVLTILEFGAIKYEPDNWRYVDNARTRYFDAAQRHILAWWQGEQTDSESGKHHLAHAVCCLVFLMWFDLVGGDNA